MKAYLIKAKKAYSEGRLKMALKSKFHPYLSAFRTITRTYSKFDIELNSVTFNDSSQEEDEKAVVERIFISYKKMKESQANAQSIYQPSKLWENQLKESYSPIFDALEQDDINKFHFFLTNFGNWDSYTGVSANMLMRRFKSSFLGRRYLKHVYFDSHMQLWNWLNGGRKDLKDLSCPLIGNQSGAYCRNTFIVPSSCPNEFNTSTLAELLDKEKRNIIGELGGGCGQFAYYLIKKRPNSSYIDFDLPETLCLAAYYLMMAFPDKKTLLYGEGDFSENVFSEFDMIFMPSFEIDKIGEDSLDLFINKNSLGEMSSDSTNNYLSFILPATKYFFHMNHEIYRNIFSEESESSLNHEFPINTQNFELLFRYPDIWHMLQNGSVDYYMDIFMYLYKKK